MGKKKTHRKSTTIRIKADWQLHACWWCNSELVLPVVSGNKYYVMCFVCHARGPWSENSDHAAAIWNVGLAVAREAADLLERVQDYQKLIAMQRSRTIAASHAFQQAHDWPETHFPDLGELIDWLMEQRKLADCV